MLSEPPRCRPVPVLALKGAGSPRGLDRGHSPGHASPPGARSTGGGWSLPASWPDPNSLRQVDPDHDERYRGAYGSGPRAAPAQVLIEPPHSLATPEHTLTFETAPGTLAGTDPRADRLGHRSER